jgi:hypothetical protein
MVKRLDEGMLRRPAQITRSCQASPEQFQALYLRRSAIAALVRSPCQYCHSACQAGYARAGPSDRCFALLPNF